MAVMLQTNTRIKGHHVDVAASIIKITGQRTGNILAVLFFINEIFKLRPVNGIIYAETAEELGKMGGHKL